MSCLKRNSRSRTLVKEIHAVSSLKDLSVLSQWLTLCLSLAGSVLTQTFANLDTPSTLQNVQMSPLGSGMDGASHEHVDYVADPEQPVIDRRSSSDLDSPSQSPITQNGDGGLSSDSSLDVDAEGSVDADYDADTPVQTMDDLSHSVRSASEESTKAGKRKLGVEDDDYMRNDPELYGLRRSVSRHVCCKCPHANQFFQRVVLVHRTRS